MLDGTKEMFKCWQVERYRPLKDDLASRFGTEERIAVKTITLPDLSLPLQLGRRENFSLFLPHHKKMAARLIEIFMGWKIVLPVG